MTHQLGSLLYLFWHHQFPLPLPPPPANFCSLLSQSW